MAETVAVALRRGAALLAGKSATARLDAELLMAAAMAVGREALLLGRLDASAPARFDALLDRRAAGEPVAYITGQRAFWTIELNVAPGVLIPRPDSETLIEAAVDHFGAAGPATVIDLGTGSGALLLAALDQWPAARGLGIDRSERALAIATRNAAWLGMTDRASFHAGEWGEGVSGRFDLLLCNPPYVRADAALPRDVADHEPAEALFAGPDGLDDYRRIVPLIALLLAPGGLAAIEIGSDQAADVALLLAEQGLVATVRRDLAGRDRCLCITSDR